MALFRSYGKRTGRIGLLSRALSPNFKNPIKQAINWRGVRRVAPNPSFRRHQPACKPGSVGHRPFARTIRDGHSSGTTLARCLEQPTRTAGQTSPPRCYRSFERTTRVAVPIRSCSRCGLPCRFRCRSRGALLPHLFTLARRSPGGRRRAVRSLWHYPWGCPRRMLSGTVCRWSPDFPLP